MSPFESVVADQTGHEIQAEIRVETRIVLVGIPPLMHGLALIGVYASAALAPLIIPIVANETPARRSFFIVLPQAVVIDAFRRSHGLFTLRIIFRWGAEIIDTLRLAVS